MGGWGWGWGWGCVVLRALCGNGGGGGELGVGGVGEDGRAAGWVLLGGSALGAAGWVLGGCRQSERWLLPRVAGACAEAAGCWERELNPCCPPPPPLCCCSGERARRASACSPSR